MQCAPASADRCQLHVLHHHHQPLRQELPQKNSRVFFTLSSVPNCCRKTMSLKRSTNRRPSPSSTLKSFSLVGWLGGLGGGSSCRDGHVHTFRQTWLHESIFVFSPLSCSFSHTLALSLTCLFFNNLKILSMADRSSLVAPHVLVSRSATIR